jgi:hypothetical protein
LEGKCTPLFSGSVCSLWDEGLKRNDSLTLRRNDTAARFDHLSISIKRMEQLLEDGVGTLPPALQQRRRLFAASPISTAFSPEDNGVWTFADLNGDGNQDLVYIKRENTGTGKIEVHGASNESLFQEHTVSISTAFPVEDRGTCLMHDWTGDGKADLIYIKLRNTGTKMVEIHVATADSGYQSFAMQTGTCFECEENDHEDDGVWNLSRIGDLVYVKTRNCGSNKIEYHVASKASNYQQFTRHSPTDFDVEDNGTWCIAPARSGDFDDLYYIKTRNTGSGKVEVHGTFASSRWKNRLVKCTTSFEAEDNGRWLMPDFSYRDRPELVYVKTSSCASGKVEVHFVEQK